jgi:phosphomethylpyrimidine synthase
MKTLLELAREGQITETIKQAALHDQISPERLAEQVAAGKAVIPANKVHLAGSLKPLAIGRIATTKINANLGASANGSSIEGEREKLQLAIEFGADAVMDLSTGGDLDATRRMFIEESPVPVGTVPMYEMIIDRDVETLTVDHILKIIAKQASQGVDFFTIHAGLLRSYIPLATKRVCGIVSRGGALLAKWMEHHNKENPLFEHFDDICAIMKEYDVAFSLGDGLRPGALADASDEAQLSELRTLGQLAARAKEAGLQVMIEGPGHVPLDQIEYNMKIQQELCEGAPFYVLGPLVTDIAAGYDHIASAIGATLAAYHGASFLCYVTPTEHLGLPDLEAVRQGVITYKIAAHSADIARGFPGARDRDDAMSKARAALDWPTMYKLALDGKRAKEIRTRNHCPGEDYCSMCGRNWCAIRISNELKAKMANK